MVEDMPEWRKTIKIHISFGAIREQHVQPPPLKDDHSNYAYIFKFRVGMEMMKK